jgi:hypothetical protein
MPTLSPFVVFTFGFIVESIKELRGALHIMDVNMAISNNKVIEEQMFKDKYPIKKKFAIN